VKHSFKIAASAALILVVALLFTGCQYWEDPAMDSSSDGVVKALYNGQYSDAISYTATLYAGQTIVAGSVKVWNDHDNLYVKYILTNGWYMTESHVAVAATLNGIPQKNGNPPPGQFPYSCTHNPRVQEYTYTIPLTWSASSNLYIATHCVAVQLDGQGRVIRTETGWAGDGNFPGKNWAKYFCYRVKKILRLPGEVSLLPQYPGPNSYWQHTLSDIGSGYDVANGSYPAWCVMENVYMTPGQTYHPVLMSSYDANLPTYAQDPDWDMVNYIINHKQGTPSDVQAAIWYFIDGQIDPPMPGSPAAAAMVNDALAHGEGYYPGSGGMLAVLCLLGDRVQLTFLEVDP
jgi:hypothetical protein